MRIVLASTSVYRRELLARLCVPFETAKPGVDEDAYKAEGLAPRALAERLAHEKSRAVFALHPDAAVIGSDQLVAFEGGVLGKPGDAETAFRQLRSMAGKTHELITAMTVLHASGRHDHTDVTRIRLRPLSDDAIRRYVAADKPLDCAGSYKIEALGISLMEKMESDDATAIQGLPLMALCRILNTLGLHIP